MAKIAIISDMHANLHAWEILYKDMQKRNVDKVICLGDSVAKYFYPKEVVDAIRTTADVVIKGNCDANVVNNENFKKARRELGIEGLDYLDNLPESYQMIVNDTLVNLYHAAPNSLDAMFNPLFKHNDQTDYKNKTITDYNQMFVGDKPQVNFFGNTHQPFIGVEENNDLNLVQNLYNSDMNGYTFTNNDKGIVNVGSGGDSTRLVYNGKKYVSRIEPFLTYVIVDDRYLKNGFNVQIVKIPYAETLKKVYFDMVKKNKEGIFPYVDEVVEASVKEFETREDDIDEPKL